MNLRDLPDMSAAYKQVQEKNDGNLANNAPPYDKVTKRDVITGRLGKDEMGGKRKKHDCAKKVNYKSEEFDVIPEQHTMLEDGTVTHYDITNGEYIYENVPVEELEILISEKHEHFDNYDKNAEVLGETKLGDTAYARARDAGAQRRRTKEYKQGLNRSTTRKEKGMYRLATAQRRTDADLERQKTTYDTGAHKGDFDRAKRAKQYKKEAFAFSEIELEELALLEEIDAMTDEQLIDMMEDLIIETAEDDQDLLEICEHLEGVELLDEDYYDSAVKASKEASKKPEVRAANRRARVERLKKAAGAAAKKVGGAVKAGAKMAGSAAKKGAKAAIGAGARAAGHAKGEFEAQRIKSKRAAMSRPEKKKEAPKSSSSDDDGTGGKLDKLLADTRGKSSSGSSDSGSSSSGGGGSSSSSSGSSGSSGSSSSGSTRKAVGGALRAVGSLVKKGLKKAVGKTARVVSKGSDKLAKRLGEDYDQIAHLYESGLFTIQEIENVIEEGYKEIDRSKENKMYRRAGNLARTGLSSKGKKKEDALNKSNKIVSAIARQKENERFKKMGDEKARDNYGG